MPVDAAYHPDPRYMTLGDGFADPVQPANFPDTLLRYRNDRWAAHVGLEGLTDAAWIAHFGRFQPLPDNQSEPLAMRYHGHQFRVYNPNLGDGRGFLFAQLRDDAGRLLDLGTKGSGQTPWSRNGDGRLTLKGGVREVLAAAMLEALGVPTSKSFSLVETGEPLQRSDEPSPTRSAVLTRLSFSHLRFGTFQRLAFHGDTERMGRLLDHILETYQPDLVGHDGPARAASWLERVVALSAHLVGRWMAAGFVHGVLNTDNMNINGESFDYGPYRFLPQNDPNFVAAYFDESGLYSFGRQPEAVYWNLQQLAACLTLIAPDHQPLLDALAGFGAAYQAALRGAMVARLGVLPRAPEEDTALAGAAFRALAEGGEALRWEPFFFDWFGGEASSSRALAGERRAIYRGEAFDAFLARLADHAPDRPERLASPYFAQTDPEALLYDEIEAIWRAIADRDDWEPFHTKLAAIDRAGAAMGVAREVPFHTPAPI
jgi:uncharacterized protein YdiU (UPF0061 family)